MFDFVKQNIGFQKKLPKRKGATKLMPNDQGSNAVSIHAHAVLNDNFFVQKSFILVSIHRLGEDTP